MARRRPSRKNRELWPILNRLAQGNVALAICITGMIRLSLDFADTEDDRPDPLAVLGFFAIMAVALVLVFVIRREIRKLPTKRTRIAAALGTFALQFIVLELLILTVAT